MTTTKALTAAALAAGAIFTMAPSASATPPKVDTHHCVTEYEAFHVPSFASREFVERRWEVRGKGVQQSILGNMMWTYPMCDPPSPGYTIHLALAQFSSRDEVLYVGTYMG